MRRKKCVCADQVLHDQTLVFEFLLHGTDKKSKAFAHEISSFTMRIVVVILLQWSLFFQNSAVGASRWNTTRLSIRPEAFFKAASDFLTRPGLVRFVPGNREFIDAQGFGQLSLAQTAPEPEIAKPIAESARRDEVIVNVTANIRENFFEPPLHYR